MKGETIMDKQLPAIYNDPYISEYFKILYKEHKEDKINETKELLDYISNMEKKIDYMTSEVLELKNTMYKVLCFEKNILKIVELKELLIKS